MSYMRSGHLLRHFKGETQSYVYSDGSSIIDYDDDYENNESFIELIGRFIERETGDEKYAFKIMKILSDKLGVKMKKYIGDFGETWGIQMTCPKCKNINFSKFMGLNSFVCLHCGYEFDKNQWLDGIYDELGENINGTLDEV